MGLDSVVLILVVIMLLGALIGLLAIMLIENQVHPRQGRFTPFSLKWIERRLTFNQTLEKHRQMYPHSQLRKLYWGIMLLGFLLLGTLTAIGFYSRM